MVIRIDAEVRGTGSKLFHRTSEDPQYSCLVLGEDEESAELGMAGSGEPEEFSGSAWYLYIGEVVG